MVLNLGQISYTPNPMKTNKKAKLMSGNKKVPRSPEEMFLMSQLPPATHSKYIQNEYNLNVHVKYDI